ncbi:unnamed protein product, partial [Rotaria sordida]
MASNDSIESAQKAVLAE